VSRYATKTAAERAAYSEANLAMLKRLAGRLTEESRGLLEAYAAGREEKALGRLLLARRLGLYRQEAWGGLGLALALLLGRA
jgi:hypothetical protein